MKGIKKFLIPTLGAVATMALASCGASFDSPNNGITKNEDGSFVVRVGNTNAAALLPTVFGPMEYGFASYAWYYGQSENSGKVQIDYTHLDDGYNAEQRAVYTSQLLRKNKAFGIVYSYEDQRNEINKQAKVEVYTPLTEAYYQESGETANFFPIQPIDYIEGKHLAATAFSNKVKGTEAQGFAASKVALITGQNSNGIDVGKGFRAEAEKFGKVENTDYKVITNDGLATTDVSGNITAAKEFGADVIVIADATYTFLNLIGAIVQQDLPNVTVLASYKLSNMLYLAGAWGAGILLNGRSLYTTGWIAAGVQNPGTYAEWAEYVHCLTDYSKHVNDGLITTAEIETQKVLDMLAELAKPAEEQDATVISKGMAANPTVVGQLQAEFDWARDGVSVYFYDSYTMAGYEGMYVFGEGISRLYADGKLENASTADYIAAMEKDDMHIPMSTIDVELGNGRRTGAEAFTLVKVTNENYTLGEPGRDFATTAELEPAA